MIFFTFFNWVGQAVGNEIELVLAAPYEIFLLRRVSLVKAKWVQ